MYVLTLLTMMYLGTCNSQPISPYSNRQLSMYYNDMVDIIPKLQDEMTMLSALVENITQEVNSLLSVLYNDTIWHKDNGSCYLIVNQNMNFDDSKMKCFDLGGYLAEVTSMEEQKYVTSLIEDFNTWHLSDDNSTNYWIGGQYLNSEWKWIESDTDIKYYNWENEVTNNKTNQCIAIQNGKWTSIQCDDPQKYSRSVCERKTTQ